MRLALDEPQNSDQVHEVEGIQFIIDRELAHLTGDITIDKTFWGILVTSQMNPVEKTGSCAL